MRASEVTKFLSDLVVLTRDHLRMLLAQLRPEEWLMVSLLYGSGLRLKDCSVNHLAQLATLDHVQKRPLRLPS